MIEFIVILVSNDRFRLNYVLKSIIVKSNKAETVKKSEELTKKVSSKITLWTFTLMMQWFFFALSETGVYIRKQF